MRWSAFIVKNSQLRGYLLVTGTDGYQSVVSWGEIGPNFGNAGILLAWEQDGKALSDKDGSRLAVPGDKYGGRYVSGVARVEVKEGGNPAVPASGRAASLPASATSGLIPAAS